MHLAKITSVFSLLVVGALAAQDDAKLLSGPSTGKFIPGPFECMNLNGAAKGRPRCLVCKFALSPAVLIFAQHPQTDENDETLVDLLKKLDDTMAEFYDDRGFSAGIVFLSPDARDSTNNTEEDKSEEILKEALLREQLNKRLSKRADALKQVIVAYHLAEGPKKFNINPKAQYTILFYERLKVLDNWTYEPGKMTAKDVDVMVTKIREVLPTVKKKPMEEKEEKEKNSGLALSPSNEEIAVLMRQIAETGHKHGSSYLPPHECQGVVDEIVSRTQRLQRNLDIRLFISTSKDRLQWQNGASATHWLDLFGEPDARTGSLKGVSCQEKRQRTRDSSSNQLHGSGRPTPGLETSNRQKRALYRRLKDLEKDDSEVSSTIGRDRE